MALDVTCPYCTGLSVLMPSEDVYGKGHDYGMMWVCRGCDAWVGTHKNSKDHAPLGRLANAELRKAKQAAHKVFDVMWSGKMKRDSCSKKKARTAGYKWLAKQMGITPEQCHIGKMDVPQCKQVVELCGPYTARL